MSSFKNKFASLVQDLRNKKSREFSKQPQPAYTAHFAEPPPPPPPLPKIFRKSKETDLQVGSNNSSVSSNIQATANATPATGNGAVRPPSRSGSIRASLRKIGSKTSLRELRRKSSFAGKSSTSVNNYGLPIDQVLPPPPLPAPIAPQQQQPQPRQQSIELTPPPSGGKGSPPPPISSTAATEVQSQYTPPQGNFEDSEDDLYSDPIRDSEKAEAAARNELTALASPPPAAPDAIVGAPVTQNGNPGPPQRPQMYIPGTNSQVLPTIPASPASTMASPHSPTNTNPFRRIGQSSPVLNEDSGPFKPISPVLESAQFAPPAKLNTDVPSVPEDEEQSNLKTASPATATKGLMNGLNFSFAPPPTEASVPLPPSPTPPQTLTAPLGIQMTPPTSAKLSPPIHLADNNPFKELIDGPVNNGNLVEQNVIVQTISAPLASPTLGGIPPTPRTIKSIAPPGMIGMTSNSELRESIISAPVPKLAPLTPLTPTSGSQFKRAPSGKAVVPENFAPPPPPPPGLPHGWTARWDAEEGRFVYYQGTKGKEEQLAIPTEPAKKLSMRDRRMKKKQEVRKSIGSLPSYTESSPVDQSPNSGSGSGSESEVVPSVPALPTLPPPPPPPPPPPSSTAAPVVARPPRPSNLVEPSVSS